MNRLIEHGANMMKEYLFMKDGHLGTASRLVEHKVNATCRDESGKM
jgi:hypothetical protein